MNGQLISEKRKLMDSWKDKVLKKNKWSPSIKFESSYGRSWF